MVWESGMDIGFDVIVVGLAKLKSCLFQRWRGVDE